MLRTGVAARRRTPTRSTILRMGLQRSNSPLAEAIAARRRHETVPVARSDAICSMRTLVTTIGKRPKLTSFPSFSLRQSFNTGGTSPSSGRGLTTALAAS